MADAEYSGVAGITLPTGVLQFVENVPKAVVLGDILRCRLGDDQLCGVVRIPPSLIGWRDPEVRCASFVGVEHVSLPELESEPPAPLALIESGVEIPGKGDARKMLSLAWREIGRLDDSQTNK